ncbi:hypothetical protein, partial [Dawidia soli]
PMEDDVVKEVKRAGVGKVVAVAGRPEGDLSTDEPPAEAFTVTETKRQELEQTTIPVQAAAACTYGWRCTASVHTAEVSPHSELPLNAKTVTPAQPETHNRPEKSNEHRTTNVAHAHPENETTNDGSMHPSVQTTPAPSPIDDDHSPAFFSHPVVSSANNSKKDRSVDSTGLHPGAP